MNKTLKRFLIMLVVLIGTIILMPHSEQADYGPEFAIAPDSFNIGYDRYNRYGLFCIEANQDWIHANTYELDKTYNLYGNYYTIDNGTEKTNKDINYLNGLAYIASQNRTRKFNADNADKEYYGPYRYEDQLCIWAYIKNMGDWTDKDGYTAFVQGSNTNISISNGKLSIVRPATSVTYESTAWYNIYEQAKINTQEYNATIKIYKDKDNESGQKFMYIEAEPQSDVFGIHITKEDEDENPLSVEFSVTYDKIKSKSGTLQSTITTNTSNGIAFISNLLLDNTTTGYITLEETGVPSDVIKLKEKIKIKVTKSGEKYSFAFVNSSGKTTGNILDGDGKAEIYSTTKNKCKIKVKNEKDIKPFKINVLKKDSAGKYRQVNFKITQAAVKNLTGEFETGDGGRILTTSNYRLR